MTRPRMSLGVRAMSNLRLRSGEALCEGVSEVVREARSVGCDIGRCYELDPEGIQ